MEKLEGGEAELIKAKTIVGRMGSPDHWFGCEYNMNIYRGCDHGCIYCDSRSLCYRVENFDTVDTKADCLAIIENDLRRKRKRGIVGTGSMSDPYNTRERDEELTRGALKLIDRYGFGIHITTKSTLVLRDLDILCSIARHSPVSVGITITTADDDLGRRIEPHAPSSSERFEALRKLNDGGICSGVLMMPILPFINDTVENIEEIVRRTHEEGGKYIFPAMGTTMRPGSRDYFYKTLDLEFPGLRRKYEETFGDQYSCGSPNEKELWARFKSLTKEYGIPYKMKDIIDVIKAGEVVEQLSFF